MVSKTGRALNFNPQYPTAGSSETVEVIIVKLGMVTASDMVMQHVFTDLVHDHNKCWIISEAVQGISIKMLL